MATRVDSCKFAQQTTAFLEDNPQNNPVLKESLPIIQEYQAQMEKLKKENHEYRIRNIKIETEQEGLLLKEAEVRNKVKNLTEQLNQNNKVLQTLEQKKVQDEQ